MRPLNQQLSPFIAWFMHSKNAPGDRSCHVFPKLGAGIHYNTLSFTKIFDKISMHMTFFSFSGSDFQVSGCNYGNKACTTYTTLDYRLVGAAFFVN